MAKATQPASAGVKIRVTKDGVFIAEDERRDTGAVETVPADIAKALIGSKHAERV